MPSFLSSAALAKAKLAVLVASALTAGGVGGAVALAHVAPVSSTSPRGPSTSPREAPLPTETHSPETQSPETQPAGIQPPKPQLRQSSPVTSPTTVTAPAPTGRPHDAGRHSSGATGTESQHTPSRATPKPSPKPSHSAEHQGDPGSGSKHVHDGSRDDPANSHGQQPGDHS